jgi:adenylate cyclase
VSQVMTTGMTGQRDNHLVLAVLGVFVAASQAEAPKQRPPARPINLIGPLHRAIVAYLALQPDMAARRETLATMFWPNSEPTRARQNLRQSLLRIRRELEHADLEILIMDGDIVRLRADRVRCDGRAFTALATSAKPVDMAEAVDLYRGPFLQDLSLSETAFDLWRTAEEQRIEAMVTQMLRQLIGDGLIEGSGARTLELAEKLVAIDPFDEASQQLLLRVIWRFHGRSAALRRADQLTAMIRQELQCEPDTETLRLMAEIRASSDVSSALETSRPAPLSGPSIAVLPFARLDGNPGTEAFCDGLTEDITTALSRLRWLTVIASSSAQAFRSKAMAAPQIAARLGVRYILEGTARTAEAQVRLTVKLVDAQTGANLWVQRYDRGRADIFAVQDAIANEVASAIEPSLYAREGVRASTIPVPNLTSWELVARAMLLLNLFDPQGNQDARVLLARAVAISPDYAKAHAVFAWSHYWAHHHLGSELPKVRQTSIDLSHVHAERALELDHGEPWAHMVHGFNLSTANRPAEALSFLDTALQLNPNFALARMLLGWAHIRAGNFDTALIQTARAMELSPIDSFLGIYRGTHGLALLASRRFEEALPFLRQAITPFPQYMGNHNVLISCCGHLGLLDEASRLLAYRERQLGISWTIHAARERMFGYAHCGVFMEGLQKAGVPE